jgi:hypothetical protein
MQEICTRDEVKSIVTRVRQPTRRTCTRRLPPVSRFIVVPAVTACAQEVDDKFTVLEVAAFLSR